jgi:hypothetical protein
VLRLLRTYFIREGYQAGTQGAEDQHHPKTPTTGRISKSVKRKAGTPSTMTAAPMLKTALVGRTVPS